MFHGFIPYHTEVTGEVSIGRQLSRIERVAGDALFAAGPFRRGHQAKRDSQTRANCECTIQRDIQFTIENKAVVAITVIETVQRSRCSRELGASSKLK